MCEFDKKKRVQLWYSKNRKKTISAAVKYRFNYCQNVPKY